MYEYFDFDYENIVFEWDKEKAASARCVTKAEKERYEHGEC